MKYYKKIKYSKIQKDSKIFKKKISQFSRNKKKLKIFTIKKQLKTWAATHNFDWGGTSSVFKEAPPWLEQTGKENFKF